jgi:hypothetical protein
MKIISSHRTFTALIIFLTIIFPSQIAFAANGRVISGDCENGWGTYRYANGDQYGGAWLNGQRYGAGTCTYSNGDKYQGLWENDRKNGGGVCAYANGDKYQGDWGNGRRNGYGTYTWASGRKYVGQWKDGEREGYGTMYDADGTVAQQGNWKANVYVEASENDSSQAQINGLEMPPLVAKLSLGMTKDEVISILGSNGMQGEPDTAIDTTSNQWYYMDVDVFQLISVAFDPQENRVNFLDLVFEPDKRADKTTVSNNITKIQKGQTLKEMLSILGYPESFCKNHGLSFAFYVTDDYVYKVYYSEDGLVDAVEKMESLDKAGKAR